LQRVWLEVHGLRTTHAPPLQTCAGEASALPQLLPSGALGFEHAPVAGLQLPAAWQTSSAAQMTGLPPTQAPLWQASLWVQALPSLQAVPFTAIGFEQLPEAGSQVPAVWHWSDGVQVTGLDPAQVPAVQA
jgi:hypothetical protein